VVKGFVESKTLLSHKTEGFIKPLALRLNARGGEGEDGGRGRRDGYKGV